MERWTISISLPGQFGRQGAPFPRPHNTGERTQSHTGDDTGDLCTEQSMGSLLDSNPGLSVRFPLKGGEKVNHVRFLMFFDTQLGGKVPLQMESAAYFQHRQAPTSFE